MVVDRLQLDPNVSVWFAMRATCKREKKAQDFLKKEGIKSFIPMCKKVLVKGGRKQYILTPAASNLIFVYISPLTIKNIKQRIPYLQYQYEIKEKLSFPIIVPTEQMENFIKLYETVDIEELTFLDPNNPNLKEGKRVRIHSNGGVLDGIEGKLVKIEGKRNRQLSVSIDGFVVVATAINIDLVEIL
ncbi:MAG: UpxY family transcription antiterminator [Bacteroidales bacterium]